MATCSNHIKLFASEEKKKKKLFGSVTTGSTAHLRMHVGSLLWQTVI